MYEFDPSRFFPAASLSRASGGGGGVVVTPPPAPASDVAAINADGWSGALFIPGAPASESWANREDVSGLAVSVARAGFDAAGAPAAFTESIALTTEIRRPWSGEDALNRTSVDGGAEARVALADFVYAGDTATGADNNSTRAHVPPQAMWLTPHMTEIDDAPDVQVFVDHRHARGGRPVAAVRFIFSDGVNPGVSHLATTPSARGYAASGLSVPCFSSAGVDLSSLNDGDIYVDVEMRPWIGPAALLSGFGNTDAYPAPSRLRLVKSYAARRYVYVDAAGGSDGSGATSPSAATAGAAPFATMSAAMTAMKSAMSNNLSGGVMRLRPGTHTMYDSSAIAAADCAFVVEAENMADVAATIVRPAGSNPSGALNSPTNTLFRGITFRLSRSNPTFFKGSVALFTRFVFSGCAFDANGFAANSALFLTGHFHFDDCVADDVAGGFAGALFGTNVKSVLVTGSTGVHGPGVLSMAGSRGGSFSFPAASSNRPSCAGAVCAFSFISSADGVNPLVSSSGAGLNGSALGISLSGTIVERVAAVGSNPAVKLWADGNAAGAANVNMHCATVWGLPDLGRMNRLYLDAATDGPDLDMSMRFCVVPWWPCKSDVFAGVNGDAVNGVERGNWPVAFHVGHRSNAMTDANGSGVAGVAEGPGSWTREAAHPGMQHGDLVADWADDRSGRTGGTGFGDYRPGALTELGAIPAGLAPYHIDQLGQPIADDGSAVIGALQKAA